MKPSPLPALGALLACAALSACPFGPGGARETVRVSLPPFPPGIPPPAGWLAVTEAGGEAQERFVPAGETAVSLEFPRNALSPVLLYPLTACPDGALIRFFRPAGCIYPYSLQADWQSGFEAHAALTLLTSNDDARAARAAAEAFNWRRLHERIASGIDNPWNMDGAKILSAIARHSFSVYAVKETAPAPLALEGAPPLLFDAYAPSPPYGRGAEYPYRAGKANLLFDGSRVFLVTPEGGADGKSGRGSLALMPGALYSYEK